MTRRNTAVPSRTPLTHLNEDEELFRDSVAGFADEYLRPLVSEMDERAEFGADLLPMLFELGLMGIEVPEEYEGAGASFLMAVLAIEELSRVDPSVSVLVDVHNTLVNTAVRTWGSEQQQKRYLPRLATEWVGAYALSEASSGCDAFSLQAKAELRGDKYVLNGRKLWITNAKEASLFLVFATVDPSLSYKGISAFLVERDTPGFSVGRKEDKLGIRASSTCELILEDCEVPVENVLGEIGRGYKVAMESLNEGRIGIGAQMIGLARGAWEAAVNYSQERTAFGKSISEFQGVHFPLAEMATELEAARLLVYNAARLKESGKKFITEAAMAKYFSSLVAEKITSQAVEIFGGYGFTKDYPVEKLYRDAKIGKIYEGTSNIQLMTIAKQILS
jgi:butyryl-CoA dehydrogenase/short/branched chain acyl-CoA dehydrogenase